MNPPTGYTPRALILKDYDAVMALWHATEGMGLGDSDSRSSIAVFLERNPGLSRVIEGPDGGVVGALLCGHDGRRGYLHHLAVARSHRRQGLGALLVDACLADLKALGIPKCNLFLFAYNLPGRDFWISEGWKARDDLVVIQKTL